MVRYENESIDDCDFVYNGDGCQRSAEYQLNRVRMANFCCDRMLHDYKYLVQLVKHRQVYYSTEILGPPVWLTCLNDIKKKMNSVFVEYINHQQRRDTLLIEYHVIKNQTGH